MLTNTKILEEKAKIEEPWRNFPDSELTIEVKEMSYQPNWFPLSKDGGGDIDLADYKE